MLSISHAVTGAFIASKLPNPILYVPLALASHYVEDWIPHWDVGTGLSNGKRSRQTAILLEFVDLGLAVALIWFFWQHAPATLQLHVALGGFTGLMPDFLEAPRNFLKWEPKWLKPINNFHGFFHHSTPNMAFGLTPQMIVVVMIGLLK